MMVYRAIVLAAMVLLSGTLSRAEKPAEFFPVMAWDSVPNDSAVLAKMRECGFSVAGFATPETLDACQAAGLKAIVSDPRSRDYDWRNVDADQARQQVTELIGQVRHHPAVYGYYLRDEPSADFFPGLAKVSSVVQELHPGAWPYINLFPNYAEAGQLGTPTYDEYLEKFVETCQPTVLSYDHYAVMEGGGMRENYYANLETMRRVAQRHKLPFWNIVLSVGCLNFREVTPTDLRFQVFTTLAYGARGIAYFKYFSAPVGNFRNAPIDQFGHETPTWQAMQFVNLQIAKLAPTLLKLKSDRVYHFGMVPHGCVGPDDESLVKLIGGQMLVGDFTHQDGTRYVMIVNTNLQDSIPCQPQFRTPLKKLEQISSYSGAVAPFEGEYVWLAPGQGVLLKLTQ